MGMSVKLALKNKNLVFEIEIWYFTSKSGILRSKLALGWGRVRVRGLVLGVGLRSP